MKKTIDFDFKLPEDLVKKIDRLTETFKEFEKAYEDLKEKEV